MAEDEVRQEDSAPLRDPERAKKSIESAIAKGTWPEREPPQETNPETEKEYPTKEEQEKKLASAPFVIDTIPPSIKRELTEKAKRMNTMAMGEGPQESQKAATASPMESVEAKGGSSTLKRILRAQEEVEKIKQGSTPEDTQKRLGQVPPEAKGYVPTSQIPYEKPAPENPVPLSPPRPLPEEKLREQVNQTPLPQKEFFLKRFWNKLKGKS